MGLFKESSRGRPQKQGQPLHEMEPRMAFEASARDRGSIEGFEAVLWTGFGVFSTGKKEEGRREKDGKKGKESDQPQIIAD